jgi:predicted nucleic acid-binding protein
MSADRVLLLDAGVWIASCDDEDPNMSASIELIHETVAKTATLDLTLYEVVNGILKRWKDPDVASELCRVALRRCRGHFVSVDLPLIEATAKIAVEYKVTSYDAAYVAVARRHDWTLVSTDIRDLVSKGLAVTPDGAV